MLKLSKKDGTHAVEFKNYYELYQYLRDQENARLLEDHPEFGKTSWSFIMLSLEQVAERYNALEAKYKLGALSGAIKAKCGLIEIHRGDITDPWLVINSPGTDVEGFRKEFCEDYCDAHGMHIEELEEGR